MREVAKPSSDDVGNDGSTAANHKSPEPGIPPRPDRPATLERTDRDEYQASRRRSYPEGVPQTHYEWNKRNQTAEKKCCKRRTRSAPWRTHRRRQPIFLADHYSHPAVAVRRDHPGDPVEQVAGDPESPQNLAHLFSFTLWNGRNMAALNRFSVVEFLMLRSSSQIVARRHREAIRNQIGATEDQNDAWRQVSPNDARDERKCRHGAIDAAVYPIPEITVVGSGRESLVDGLAGVLVLHIAFSLPTIQRRVPGTMDFFNAAGDDHAGSASLTSATREI